MGHITQFNYINNTLDLFTDHPSQIIDINVLPGMSDHDIVIITAEIKTKFKVQSPRLYHKADWNAIRQSLLCLQLISSDHLLTENDVEYLTTFKNTILDFIEGQTHMYHKGLLVSDHTS